MVQKYIMRCESSGQQVDGKGLGHTVIIPVVSRNHRLLVLVWGWERIMITDLTTNTLISTKLIRTIHVQAQQLDRENCYINEDTRKLTLTIPKYCFRFRSLSLSR